MNLNKIITQLILGAMILIMAALLVNKAVYIHVHVLPDGTLITHAHPFNKTSEPVKGQTHHHSSLEFFIFQGLELMMLTSMMALVLMKAIGDLEKRWFTREPFTLGQIDLQPGRAPPHCM